MRSKALARRDQLSGRWRLQPEELGELHLGREGAAGVVEHRVGSGGVDRVGLGGGAVVEPEDGVAAVVAGGRGGDRAAGGVAEDERAGGVEAEAGDVGGLGGGLGAGGAEGGGGGPPDLGGGLFGVALGGLVDVERRLGAAEEAAGGGRRAPPGRCRCRCRRRRRASRSRTSGLPRASPRRTPRHLRSASILGGELAEGQEGAEGPLVPPVAAPRPAGRGARAQPRTSAGRRRMSAMIASGSRPATWARCSSLAAWLPPVKATTFMPAAFAAWMPAGLSSTTRQAAGG